ncbi:hypothetical protein D9M69_703740 [compost metagenome]
MDVIFAIELIHLPDIEENLEHKDVDGTLLGKPEPQGCTEETDGVECINQQNAEAERHQEPDSQQDQHPA